MFEKGDLVEVIKYDEYAHKKFEVGTLHYVRNSSSGSFGGNVYFKSTKKGKKLKGEWHEFILLGDYVRKVVKK